MSGVDGREGESLKTCLARAQQAAVARDNAGVESG